MSGKQKFLAVAAWLAKGKGGTIIDPKEVRKAWLKTLLKIKYNSSFYHRAEISGWVDPVRPGEFSITNTGFEHLVALVEPVQAAEGKGIRSSKSLLVFEKKATHSFDSYLRGIFANAKRQVLIADSYVDGTIFHTVLGTIPQDVKIKLVYGRAKEGFDANSKRFMKQYQKCEIKRNKRIHDRFVISDNNGYIIGPSLKDAASNYPATIVKLRPEDTRLLETFFGDLWRGKA